MKNKQLKEQIRKKKMGILIRDARISANRTVEMCANAVGVSESDFTDFEKGIQTPSLAELMTLGSFLRIPVLHFLGSTSRTESLRDEDIQKLAKKKEVFRQNISERIKEIRESKDISVEKLAEDLDIDSNQFSKFEENQSDMNFILIERILDYLSIPLDNLIIQEAASFSFEGSNDTLEQFQKLPPDFREFISKPVNFPFIELAMQLSNFPVDKLRVIAESLLDITY